MAIVLPRVVVLLLVGMLCVYLCVSPACGASAVGSDVRARMEAARAAGEETAKYWVYFVDKHEYGVPSSIRLEERRGMLAAALHPDAVARRRLMLNLSESQPDADVISIADVPISKAYVAEVLEQGSVTVRKHALYRNAVSISVPVAGQEGALERIVGLNCVKKVTPVQRGKCKSNKQPAEEVASPREAEKAEEERTGGGAHSERAVGNYDYGGSAAQLAQLHVPELHDFGLDGTGVTVLVCDSGFDVGHRCFASMAFAGQHDFVNDDDDVENTTKESGYSKDPEEHGTATLSCVGGMDDGFLYGPAFRATFLLAKTEDIIGECELEEDNMEAALEWGEQLGVSIVSTSLGYQDWHTFADKDGSCALDETIDRMAGELGVLVVIAAGNDHRDNMGVTVPADSNYGLTVGAVSSTGAVTEFSSRGPTVDGRIKPEVCALGYHDHVASVGTQDPPYTAMSGTSFATPLVAGVAALLKQQHPQWTPMDLREALITTASDADEPTMATGWGVVNAAYAIDYTRPNPPQHGVCYDFSDCDCEQGWYGAYCKYERVDCELSCIGGDCDDDGNCKCDTRWKGKTCIGPCEAVEAGCTTCLRVGEVECGWCVTSQLCMEQTHESECTGELATAHCDTVIAVGEQDAANDSVMAVIILCFSILLVASVTLTFFCIVRPTSSDSTASAA